MTILSSENLYSVVMFIRVMALVNGGGYAEFVAAHEDHLMPLPESWDFVQGAAVPEVFLTAFQLLHTVGINTFIFAVISYV